MWNLTRNVKTKVAVLPSLLRQNIGKELVYDDFAVGDHHALLCMGKRILANNSVCASIKKDCGKKNLQENPQSLVTYAPEE